MSPWVVTAEALAPFLIAAFARPEGDPAPLPYLDDADDRAQGGLDITLEAYLVSDAMRRAGTAPFRLDADLARRLYWTVAQMMAHHTSNGCNLRDRRPDRHRHHFGPGEIELGEPPRTHRARQRADRDCRAARRRGFIEDGDEIIFRGFCAKPGHARIGFGECRAEILPAE